MKQKSGLCIALGASLGWFVCGFGSVARTQSSTVATQSTNVVPNYVEAVHRAQVAGTEATNLTQGELSNLMNESIKTNLAAQLWFRTWLGSTLSAGGSKIAGELRVLKSLRAGRTNDAIRELEEEIDRDSVALVTHLSLAEKAQFKWTPQSLTALQSVREYRSQYPYRSGNAVNDERVRDALAYPDKK